MTVRRRRNQLAPKPVVLPQSPDIRKAKNLPMFGPGIKIRIPLHLWPAYKDLYHLVPTGYLENTNVLLVKRVLKSKDKSNA